MVNWESNDFINIFWATLCQHVTPLSAYAVLVKALDAKIVYQGVLKKCVFSPLRSIAADGFIAWRNSLSVRPFVKPGE